MENNTIYSLGANAAGQLFAARDSGLYGSPDGGNSWNYAYQSLLGDQPLPTLSISTHGNTLLAGTPGAVLCSTDGGATWQVAKLATPTPIVVAVACSPDFETDGTAYAATSDDGVFCSYDHGLTWTAWNFGLLDANGLCIAVSPDHAVYFGASSGLFRSTNAGKSWECLRLPCDFDAVLSIAAAPEDVLLVGTEANGLYRSTDQGITWDAFGADAEFSPINAILLPPHSSEVVLLSGQGLLHSSDLGQTFSPWLTDQLPDSSGLTSACFAPGGRIFLSDSEQIVELGIE
jgi:photosystem II stability/assembly factor-like uncharacterized protein